MLPSILTLTCIIILKLLFRRFYFNKIAGFKKSFLNSQDFPNSKLRTVGKKCLKKIMSFKSFESVFYFVCSLFLAVYVFSPVMSYTTGEALDLKSLFQFLCPQGQSHHIPLSSTHYFSLALGGLSFVSLGYFLARSQYSSAFQVQDVFLRAFRKAHLQNPQSVVIDFKNPSEIKGTLTLLSGKLEMDKNLVDQILKPFQHHQVLLSQIKQTYVDEIRPGSELKELPYHELSKLLCMKTIQQLSQVTPEVSIAKLGLLYGLDLEKATRLHYELAPFYDLVEQTQHLKKADPQLLESLQTSTGDLVKSLDHLQGVSTRVSGFECQDFFQEILQELVQP